ncbi:MAG: ComEA family DNA-binding protein [Candidatus Kapaibacteriota bacterium]
MSILDPFRRATGLTTAESAVVLTIAVVFVAGWIGRSLLQPQTLHQQEAAERVIAMLDSLAQQLPVDTTVDVAIASAHTLKPTSTDVREQKHTTVIHRISVNSSSLRAWEQLPGIGPSTARAILAEQRVGPFQSIDDLQRVRGIGPKKLERLRPYLTVP